MVTTHLLLLAVLLLLLLSATTTLAGGGDIIKCESTPTNTNNDYYDHRPLLFDSWDGENFRFFDSWDPHDSCTSIDSKSECLETLGCKWVGNKNVIIPILINVFVAMMACVGAAVGIYCCYSWCCCCWRRGNEEIIIMENNNDKEEEEVQNKAIQILDENNLAAFILQNQTKGFIKRAHPMQIQIQDTEGPIQNYDNAPNKKDTEC